AAGDFTAFNGQARNRVVRLNSNGSVDTTFNPGLGPNGTVWALALQADGKVVIGGDFTMVGGQPRNFVARLNANGTLDTSFNPGIGPDGPVQAIAVQADGKILIGGEFATVGGVGRGRIARLNADGTLDLTHNPGTGADRRVFAVRLQPDGKALIGGEFTDVDQRSRRGIARLNTDGSLDTSFDPGTGTDDAVYSIALQNDGRILIGGIFTSYNETRRVGIARLYASGALDTTFMDTAFNQFAGVPTRYHNTDVEPRNFILALGVEPSGHVMIGGYFQRVGGGFTRTDMLPRRNVARLIGGETPGPGNLELMEDRYERDEDGVSVYVSLVRTNGDRGIASARFLAMPYPTGPGAAPFTNFTLLPAYTRPFWDEAWPGPNPPDWGRTHADATWGPNFATAPAGVDTADVLVEINNNTLLDGDRSLEFVLYRPSGTDWTLLGGENIPFGVAINRRTAPMTIIDDDRRPGVLGFSLTNFVVSEAVGKALVTVTRTNGSSGTVTVNYRTVAGSVPGVDATAGSDYAPTNGTLTFLPGEVTKNFEVTIVDDSLVENDERILLQLFAPGGGATLGLANSRITIVDNDYPAGRINFSSASYVTNENARFAVITVTRTGGAAGTVTVQCSTIPGGTATAGADYTSVTNTLVWNNGDVSPKTLLVPLLDDLLIEPNETITLRLSNGTLNGAPDSMVLGAITTATLTLVSDDAFGTLGLSTASYLVNENGGPVTITVVRSGGSVGTISVNYSVTAVPPAVPGVDFIPTSGTLVFGPGEFSKSFTIQILDNAIQDGARSLAVLLSGASPSGTLGSPASAQVTIIDDESVNEPPGEPDTAFRSPFSLNGPVLAMALQPDGKLVIAGDFTLANASPRNRIARINTDDSVDTGFSSAAPTAGANATVRALLRQSDGALVIGGDFTTVDGINRNRIARLRLNGTLDTDFNPGAGADNPVLALGETFVNGQRKILIAGNFTTVDSRPFNRVARLHNDGTPDLSFNPGLGANDYVYALAVQPDGRILIGGDFTTVNGVPRHRIARLHPDGSLDLSFDPGTGANAAVRAIALQTDGRIVIGGSFTNYNGQTRFRVARLLPDGALDTTFDPGEGGNDTVDAIVIQPDHRIVLGGKFTRFSGVTRNRVTRLNSDGSMDPTINFGTGANNFVAAALVQPDGKIVIGGGFTEYDGQPRSHLARIYGRSISGSGKFEFAAATFFVNENGTNALITVRRRGGTSNPAGHSGVTVNAQTSDGTALQGVHYLGGTFPLFFPAGEALQTFQIPVLDDFEINSDRTVNLSLGTITPPGSAGIGNQPTATLVIVNDDAGIHFSAPSYSRNENAVDGGATISIVRSGSTLGTASVIFRTTTTGTATPGLDFTPVFTNVTFNPGETLKNVFIAITNDTAIEGDETVGLQLMSAVGAVLVTPFTATLTIVDDDFGPGALQFAFATNSVAENAGFANIWVVRTNGRTGIVTADYFTRDITAAAGLDYTA
ncbi:MAG: Calx-beta domain-containing protein, partial [Verrucomicrobiales bacterium]|nr:Calx-beta domain-containing protein [Verrucomicrobiales bacterium]